MKRNSSQTPEFRPCFPPLAFPPRGVASAFIALRGSYVKCKNVFTQNCGTVDSLATSLTTEFNKIIKTQLIKKEKQRPKMAAVSCPQSRVKTEEQRRVFQHLGADRLPKLRQEDTGVFPPSSDRKSTNVFHKIYPAFVRKTRKMTQKLLV